MTVTNRQRCGSASSAVNAFGELEVGELGVGELEVGELEVGEVQVGKLGVGKPDAVQRSCGVHIFVMDGRMDLKFGEAVDLSRPRMPANIQPQISDVKTLAALYSRLRI